jgi:hypothetical protein
VRVRRGDFSDPSTLDSAFEGAEQVLVVSVDRLGDEAVEQHKSAIDAAYRAGTRLYVADTGASHRPDGPRHILVFDARPDGTWSEGVLPDGTLIGKVLVPETVANVTFGGLRRSRLFICATSGLYAVHLAVRGAPVPPRLAEQ